MRPCLLALLSLLVVSPVAHADNLSFFSISLGPDLITFLVSTSPAPVEFPSSSAFTLTGIAITDLYRDAGTSSTSINDITFYAGPSVGCYCEDGGLTVSNIGVDHLDLNLLFGYYNDANSTFFTGTPQDPTFISGSFGVFNTYPDNPAFVQISPQNTPVPEPSTLALVSSSFVSLVAAGRSHLRSKRDSPQA